MKKITWQKISFWTVYGAGLITLTALGIWLLYQTFAAMGIVLKFLCGHINPVFGIITLCAVLLAAIFDGREKNTAETRK